MTISVETQFRLESSREGAGRGAPLARRVPGGLTTIRLLYDISAMPVQFIGAIGAQNAAEGRPAQSPVVDKSFVRAFTQAHEDAGFDRVLIGYFSSAPDGFQIAAYAAQQTERLKFLLAHRPGFVAPTVAARQLATLDQFIDGRLAVHIITGGADHEQAKGGDFLDKATRYERTDEYIELLKKTWTSEGPFDHAGAFYKVVGSFSAVRCARCNAGGGQVASTRASTLSAKSGNT